MQQHTRNQFDRNIINHETDQKTQYLDDPSSLATRFMADARWRHKSNERMSKCEELLTNIMSRSKKPGSNKLLSFHSEVLMLGGGDARFAIPKRNLRQQTLNGVSQKQKRYNPIKYTSPLSGSGSGPKKKSAGSPYRRSKKRGKRPSSAATSRMKQLSPYSRPTSPNSSPSQQRTIQRQRQRQRPQSATAATTRKQHSKYILTGITPSTEYIRPYSAALPIRLDLPWMRIKPEKSTWRASWEPSKPLTYTPKEQLKPIVKKKKKYKVTDPNEHRVVDWARRRRALLEPLMKEKNVAACTIQRFFAAIQSVSIRDRWIFYRAGNVKFQNKNAIIIQKHVRGHFTRLYLIEKKRQDESYRLNCAASIIQNNWRIILSKQRLLLFRKIVAMKKRHAAAHIQRGFRRGAVGRRVKKMVAKAGEFGKNAITKMQGMFRGKLSRRKTFKKRKAFMEKMNKSATALQSRFRGFFSRKKKKEKKQKKVKSMHKRLLFMGETKENNGTKKTKGGFFSKKKKKKKIKKKKKR